MGDDVPQDPAKPNLVKRSTNSGFSAKNYCEQDVDAITRVQAGRRQRHVEGTGFPNSFD